MALYIVPLEEYLVQSPLEGDEYSSTARSINTFTKFFFTLFNAPLRGKKQIKNF
jgi:hypothetical protein